MELREILLTVWKQLPAAEIRVDFLDAVVDGIESNTFSIYEDTCAVGLSQFGQRYAFDADTIKTKEELQHHIDRAKKHFSKGKIECRMLPSMFDSDEKEEGKK